MIKYLSHALTFAEVPDEVTLCINITNCPHHCPGCHSPELQQDTGRDLTQALPALLDKYGGDITCVCLMGEGNDIQALGACLAYIWYRGFKAALYTGRDTPGPLSNVLRWLDYLKLGPYIEALGGLDKPTTNQRMYRLTQPDLPGPPDMEDITYLFWPHDE